MTQPGERSHNLRVRKAERTRAALVDAAVELCLSRGYDNTTVEHIASAADVSARTFSRYFPSKDAVFVSLLDDIADEVAGELRSLDADLGPLEAMRAALGVVLTRAQARSAHRITRTIGVLTASGPLRQAAIDYRGPQVMAAMAQRMNVAVDDRRLALAMVIISVSVVQAWTDLADADVALQPSTIARQIDRVFADLGAYAADLDPAWQPPSS